MDRGFAGLSRWMAGCSALGVGLYPLLLAVTFLFPQHTGWLMFDVNHLGSTLSESTPLPYRLGALACAAVPAGFIVWALWSLHRLFLCYAAGEVFSAGPLKHLTHVAVALFANVIVAFAMQAPISFLLSWPLGHGHREISLAFGSGDVEQLFTAGVMLVIARVMAEARRMADENAKFV
ncbi:MAG: DUF2975 domain-containing protein [Alphaproteobacteria bacterium]|nr:DUF2975 domain-containing protein [Alphaproteobacteria bacterium]